MLPDARILIPELVEAFDEVGIPYYIGGSVASSTFGGYKVTQDVDIVVQMGDGDIEKLVDLLSGSYYIDAEMIREAIGEGGMFNVIHLASMFKADVYVPHKDPWSVSQMQRRRMASVDPNNPNVAGFVSSPEDILLQKIKWYRIGREVSQKQWTDILDVALVQRKHMDYSYLDKWAAVLGISDLLAKAFSQVDAEVKEKIQD